MDDLAEQHDDLDGSLGIAIIGMAARFPGAKDVGEFWENLCAGRETIRFFGDEELRAAGVSQAELDDPNYVKAAPVLDDIDRFDAAFFDCSPLEATFMDPQQRLLLECAWQALEDAGYGATRGAQAVGVYAGVKMNTYVGEFFAHADLFGPQDRMLIMLGNGEFSLSTRISYKLDLKGPSYMLQTACSTSLAAVHLACQGLLLDECRMALAGAVAVEVPHQAGYYYQPGGPASPDGHCRPFDAQAQGTVFGSGIGMVVLKRLGDALADGDRIYAVIRGTAVNNDGGLKASFTAPSVEGQTRVIMEALACANVDAETIGYVEAHGTATPLGDPIEIMALTNAFRASTQRNGFCRIGSVKGNVGHLDATAGLAGLIKAVLALKHRQIPPSLYFEQPNPEIDFASSPFVVNTELTAWERGPFPRRAGVSSFGFGGTNTHVVLEEAPAVAPSGASRPWQLLLLSAKTETALDAATANLATYLGQMSGTAYSQKNTSDDTAPQSHALSASEGSVLSPQSSVLDDTALQSHALSASEGSVLSPQSSFLADVAYTLQVGRAAFTQRRALVCRDTADAVRLLEHSDDPRVATALQETGERPVVFMFPGQGAQYVNMGRELYQHEPVFREAVDHCAALLRPHLGLDLREVLYPEEQRTENKEQNREHHLEEPRTKNQEPGADDRPTTNNERPFGSAQSRPTTNDGTGTIDRAPTMTNEQPTTNDGTGTIDRAPTMTNEQPTTNDSDDPITQNSTLKTQNFPNPQSLIPNPQSLGETWLTQPALFVVEYALAKLWMSWGVRPQALIGHSVGEYVAACLAGVFSLEEGLALIAARGRLMQQLPAGAMLTVALPEAELRPLLGEQLSLAAINGPARCVVSGPLEAVEQLERRLTTTDVSCRRLHTSHAFHSAMMEPILEPFRACFKAIRLRPPQIPYISNSSGTWVRAEEATSPAYWAFQLRQPVRFAEGLDEVAREHDPVLLEVGPGHTLGTLARQSLAKDAQPLILASLPDPNENQSAGAFVLTTLGSLWLAGVQVDWAGFYAGERRQRVSLPGYPFERRRYWFEPPTTQAPRRTDAVQTQEQHAQKKPDIADWFYTPSWKRSPLPARDPQQRAPRRWLLFADECGLGAQLAQRLEQEDHDVTMVRSGPAFGRSSERVFTLNPGRAEDYDALVKQLYASERGPAAVVHLWNVTQDEAGSALEQVDRAQERGFYSLLYLAQALGKQDAADELEIVAVSNHLHEVTGAEAVHAEKATLLGPVRVIPLEYPNISCRSVDVALPHHTGSAQDLVELLLTEMTARSSDQVIAHRGHHRWVQAFEPIRLEKPQGAPVCLREAGVYLITGGMGGIGLAIARYLAETVHARLILTGRARLPERDAWDRWLATHDEQDRVSEKLRAVQALERLGAQVMVAGADVADHEQMRALVAEAYERFGTIHGVIHAAGVPGGGIIQLKTPQMAADVLAPKVKGALVLDDLFQDARLDFLLLFSSLSAVVGEFGQVDYCAANAFLDALAYRYAPGAGRPIRSINWDMWREVGMTVQTSVPAVLKEWREEQLTLAMLSSEGVEVFGRALSQPAAPQIMVCTTDIHSKIEQFRALTRSRILGDVDGLSLPGLAEPGSRDPRPNLRTPYLAPRNETERTLANIWQSVLGIERVGIQDSFFELGGDSLIGLKLIARLKQEFGVEIPAVDLYKGPTISRLADIINQVSGQAPPDESARQAGQQRGAQRREWRRQQKRQADPAGG